MAKLTEPELEAILVGMEGWRHEGEAIHKDFTLAGFRGAIDFVNRVAELADAARHHPDIEIHYRRVVISLSTHDEGGVTEKDVALAAEIDAAAGRDTAAEPSGG